MQKVRHTPALRGIIGFRADYPLKKLPAIPASRQYGKMEEASREAWILCSRSSLWEQQHWESSLTRS
jgi:hypothetical protein